MKKVEFHIFIIILILGSVFIFHRQTVRYNELSSSYGTTTVCHVYDKYQGKATTYYKYIYKVGSSYYTCAVGGVNTSDLDREPVQCFLLVYHKKRPSHHVILRNQKLDDIKGLGIIMEQPKNFKNLVEMNTARFSTAVPDASVNDMEEIKFYKRKKKAPPLTNPFKQ